MKDCEYCEFFGDDFFCHGKEQCDYDPIETLDVTSNTCEVCKYFTAENEDFGVCDVLNDLIVNPVDRTCEFFKFDKDYEEDE